MNCALLKAERLKRGITQESLAKDLGFKDKSSYCLIEKGKTKITTDTAYKIAMCLSLSKEVTFDIFFKTEGQDTSTENILGHGGEKENAKC